MPQTTGVVTLCPSQLEGQHCLNQQEVCHCAPHTWRGGILPQPVEVYIPHHPVLRLSLLPGHEFMLLIPHQQVSTQISSSPRLMAFFMLVYFFMKTTRCANGWNDPSCISCCDQSVLLCVISHFTDLFRA